MKGDGGPAFPQNQFSEGVTVRDYFAAAALPMSITECSAPDELERLSRAAQRAYRYADAMMKARGE